MRIHPKLFFFTFSVRGAGQSQGAQAVIKYKSEVSVSADCGGGNALYVFIGLCSLGSPSA